MNRWSALAMLLAIVGALALRVPRLATRPLHNDEGVNAIKVAELWQHGRYVYDPDEYHGPTLHYATLPFLWLSGARNADELDDATLRLAPILFGVGLILLLLLFSDGLGSPAVVWAAIFTAVSPAMVFHSRYFIHEIALVFFTTLTLGAGWRYVRTCSPRWAVIAGAGLGLMFATKETFIIAVGAMLLAGIVTLWWMKRERVGSVSGFPPAHEPNQPLTPTLSPPRGEGARRAGDGDLLLGINPQSSVWVSSRSTLWNWKHVALALAAAFLIWLLFFSSFFTNFSGLADSFRTYLPWFKRAGGHSPHIHPWNFYLHRLAWFHPAKGPVWSEGFILILAMVGAGISLAGRKSPLHRFLALYTIILTAIYAAIPYKTPWCLLSFFQGMIVLAGVGAAALLESWRGLLSKALLIALLLGLMLQLAWQAWRASFVYVADRRNPYVYAQTVPDILNLVQRAEGLARVAPTGHATVVKVIASDNDYWPLPWYLRRFKSIGWYEKLPEDPFAPVIIVSSRLEARLDEKSDKKWLMAGLFELRPEKFFELYVDLELWKRYVETLPRERE